MKTMTRRGGLVLVVAAALAVTASGVEAQRGGGVRGQAVGPNMGRSLDVILEQQEELGLTQDQRGELESLKATMDAEVIPISEEIRALRDRVRAGEVDWNEGGRELQALHGQLLTASAPLRGRVQEILTVEQHRNLQRQMQALRPGVGRGGAVGFRGRGAPQGPQGQLRGSRGGFGPRQGFNGQGRAPAFGFRQAAPGFPGGFPQPQGRGFRQGGWDLPEEGGEVPPKG